MKIYIKLALVFLLAFHINAYSQFEGRYYMKSKYHSFGSFVVLTAEGGGSLGLTDFKTPRVSYFGKGGLEIYFPSQSFFTFGLRGSINFLEVSGRHSDTRYVGDVPNQRYISVFKTKLTQVEGDLALAFGNKKLIPYLAIGGGYTFKFNPTDQNNATIYSASKKGFFSLIGEIGMRYFLTNTISFNVSTRYHAGGSDELDGFVSKNKDSYWTASAGFSLHIFHNYRIR